MGRHVFRHYHKPAGQFVQPVDNPRSHGISGREGAQVKEEGIDQSPGADAGSGVADHAGGFFHDRDICILEDQVERDVLRLRLRCG
jgi:hypothetical protein